MLKLMAIVADVNLGNPPEQKQFRPCKMKIVWKQVHEKKCAARWKVTLINPGKFQLRLLSIPRCLAYLGVCISRCLAFLDASKCHLIRARNSLTVLKFAWANKTCIQDKFQNIVKEELEFSFCSSLMFKSGCNFYVCRIVSDVQRRRTWKQFMCKHIHCSSWNVAAALNLTACWRTENKL